MLKQPIAFVDVETTGLNQDIHEIIELGATIARIRDDGSFEMTDRVDFKITPKNITLADPQALRVNGYNEGDWLFACSLEEAMKDFAKKTEGCIFAAHNLVFDYAFVQKAFEKTGIENKMHFHKMDTISLAFGVLHNQGDDLGKYSLRVLCEKYGIENKHAHSAFADSYATFEVFKKLLKLK